MDKLMDMHVHTSASDGDFSADEVIEMAKEVGIGTIAITDHDTLLGVKGIKEAHPGIEIIPGIEISVKVPVGRMHMLGYDINVWDDKLNKRMTDLHNRSFYSVMAVICQLKKDYDIVLSTEEVLSILNKKTNIGRPDIAKILINNGYVENVKEAFDKYLVDAYEKSRDATKGISKKESIELIKEAGGLAVLAHPHSLKLSKEELDEFVRELVKFGLDGIEVYHSDHTSDMQDEYLELADKYNLLISGGTDYHGPIVKPDISLGTGRDNVKVKQLSLVDSIHNKNK